EGQPGVERARGAPAERGQTERRELLHRELVVVRAERSLVREEVEDPASPLDRPPATGLAVRVHARGRLRDGDEEGGLRPAEIVDGLPEVTAAGGRGAAPPRPRPPRGRGGAADPPRD